MNRSVSVFFAGLFVIGPACADTEISIHKLTGLGLDTFYGACAHPHFEPDSAKRVASAADWPSLSPDAMALWFQQGSGLELHGWMAAAPFPHEHSFPLIIGEPSLLNFSARLELRHVCFVYFPVVVSEFIEVFEYENEAEPASIEDGPGERTRVYDLSKPDRMLIVLRYRRHAESGTDPEGMAMWAYHLR